MIILKIYLIPTNTNDNTNFRLKPTMIMFKQVIAFFFKFILITTFSFASIANANDDNLIIGEDLTLTDVEYSEAEIQEFKKQLLTDKEMLRSIYYGLGSEYGDDRSDFDYIFNQALQLKQASMSFISVMYHEKIREDLLNPPPQISRIFAFLKFGEAVAGDLNTQYSIGYLLGLDPIQSISSKDSVRSYYWLTRVANYKPSYSANTEYSTNASYAAFILGLKYFAALDYYPHHNKLKQLAERYLTQAAESGQPEAEYTLSNFYTHSEEFVKAAQWMQTAANAGLSKAAGQLGLMYACGKGVPTDYEKAFYWTQKGADGGDGRSFGILGMLYEQGFGTDINNQKALSYFEKGCNLGDEVSCNSYHNLKQKLNK